jgi:hypothetical protein
MRTGNVYGDMSTPLRLLIEQMQRGVDEDKIAKMLRRWMRTRFPAWREQRTLLTYLLTTKRTLSLGLLLDESDISHGERLPEPERIKAWIRALRESPTPTVEALRERVVAWPGPSDIDLVQRALDSKSMMAVTWLWGLLPQAEQKEMLSLLMRRQEIEDLLRLCDALPDVPGRLGMWEAWPEGVAMPPALERRYLSDRMGSASLESAARCRL